MNKTVAPPGFDKPESEDEMKMSNYMPDRSKQVSGGSRVTPPIFGGYKLDDIDPDLLSQQITLKVSIAHFLVHLLSFDPVIGLL